MSRSSDSAPVMELFASVQGEGLFAGEAQTFLRLRGCPLRCRYCDTPESWLLRGAERGSASEPDPGPDGSPVAFPGPAWATPFRAATWIAAAEPGRPRTVSVTGGEPLLWPEFVRELRGFLGGRRVHLETAGAHPRALARVLERVDHVSLDLKPAADLDAPVPVGAAADGAPGAEPSPRTEEDWRRVRAEVLGLVRGRDACLKLVVVGESGEARYLALLDEVEELAPDLPLYLQPATPVRGVRAPEAALLACLHEAARDRDLDARVLPQLHRVLGLP